MQRTIEPRTSSPRIVKSVPRTTASLFIVESVSFDDEAHGRVEGNILSQMLGLAAKETEYRYIRTRQELEVVLRQFRRSTRRYLHLSCHGGPDGVATTLDHIGFDELGGLIGHSLDGRRLFVSACQAVNDDLAGAVMRKQGCLSIVGPDLDVGFDEAAVMWAAFYYLMFKANPSSMNSSVMEKALRQIQDTFEVPVAFIRRTDKAPYWRWVNL